MLYLHETHRVAGARAEEFEEAWRRDYAPTLAATDEIRLLWFMHHAHGTGPSYVVVTVTALADGAAWERLARRLEEGDLRSWARDIDAMRHDSTSKLLAPVAWSAMQDVDLSTLGAGDAERDPVLYMEDTVRPFAGKLDDYLHAASTLYAQDTLGKRLEEGTSLLDLRGCFRTIAGPYAGREVILWQKVVRPELLPLLLTMEIPAEHRGPGTWMREALAYRDGWESRLLRTAAWSPVA